MKYYIIKESDMVDIADAIRAKRGTNELLSVDQMKTEIPDITTDSSADYVRYVTFRNESTGEEFVKSVAIGDDCVDVVVNGLWPTPTRESDAQYDYTFYGWGASDDGAADADILKNVTEDKTVYAIYTKTVKYYTITYYDEDGTTVLKTETLAYGRMPSYEPTKDGYLFIGWTPAIAMVTGDASYTSAGWEEGYVFADTSWAKIAELSAAGKASKTFAIGDTKTIKGQNYNTIVAQIVGFDHDDLADGSGKAGITLLLRGYDPNVGRLWHVTSYGHYYKSWGVCDLRDNLHNQETCTNYENKELRALLKTVSKKYYDEDASVYTTSDDIYFLPSLSELNYSQAGRTEEGEAYPGFINSRVITKPNSSTAIPYWTRTHAGSKKVYAVTADGTVTTHSQGASNNPYYAYVLACI